MTICEENMKNRNLNMYTKEEISKLKTEVSIPVMDSIDQLEVVRLEG